MFRSISSSTYLFSEILIAVHIKAELCHGHFNELEPSVFLQKSPCSEQIRTLIFVDCDWSIKIQVQNLRNSEFQNEASDVILGNPTAVHLILTAGPVVVSPRSSRWTGQGPWSPPEQFARFRVYNNAHVCVPGSCVSMEVCSADWWPGHARPFPVPLPVVTNMAAIQV